MCNHVILFAKLVHVWIAAELGMNTQIDKRKGMEDVAWLGLGFVNEKVEHM